MTSDQYRFEWRGRKVVWTKVGHGPPVVMCHGTPWSSALWSPFADALARDFTVYRWDMPGYGESSKDPNHAVDLGVQGEVFSVLLEHWGLQAPRVVAHDFGGAVALRAHLLHGAQFASLCLVDVVVLRPWGSAFFELVKASSAVFSELPATVHRGAIEAYISSASHRGLRDDELSMLTRPWVDDEGQLAFYRQIAQADDRYTAELEPLLATIKAPTHIVWGKDDEWIPVDRAYRLREAIPHSSLDLVPGAGHLIQLDAPVALALILQRWLTGTPGTGQIG